MQQSKLLFSVFLLIHKMLSQKYIKLDSLIHKKEIYSGWMSPKCLFWFLWTTLWSRINVSPADIYLWNYTGNILMGVMGGWVVSPHLYLKNVIFKSIRYVFFPQMKSVSGGFCSCCFYRPQQRSSQPYLPHRRRSQANSDLDWRYSII